MIQQDQTENNCCGGVDEILHANPNDVNVVESFASHHLDGTISVYSLC